MSGQFRLENRFCYVLQFRLKRRLNKIYNIASRAAQSNSVYVSVLKISIVHADSVSKSLRQNFCFLRERSLLALEILHFATIMDTNRDSAHQSKNEDNFATFSLGLGILNEAEKEKNNGKGDSASAPSRFASLSVFASDLMHNSTGYVIKLLAVHYRVTARGKFGEHSRSFFRASFVLS